MPWLKASHPCRRLRSGPRSGLIGTSAEICCAAAVIKGEAFAPAGWQASLQTQASLE